MVEGIRRHFDANLDALHLRRSSGRSTRWRRCSGGARASRYLPSVPVFSSGSFLLALCGYSGGAAAFLTSRVRRCFSCPFGW